VTGVEGEVLQVVEVVAGRSWPPNCLGVIRHLILLVAWPSAQDSAKDNVMQRNSQVWQGCRRKTCRIHLFQNCKKLFAAAKKAVFGVSNLLCGVACARFERHCASWYKLYRSYNLRA